MNIKKLLPLAGVVLLILLIIVLYQTLTTKEANILPQFGTKEFIKDTNNIEEVLTTPQNNTPVQGTGAKITKYTTEEKDSIEQFRTLRLALPIETSDFSMSKLNFDTFKITVTFKNIGITNKQGALNQWLESNGFSKVEQSYFDIK